MKLLPKLPPKMFQPSAGLKSDPSIEIVLCTGGRYEEPPGDGPGTELAVIRISAPLRAPLSLNVPSTITILRDVEKQILTIMLDVVTCFYPFSFAGPGGNLEAGCTRLQCTLTLKLDGYFLWDAFADGYAKRIAFGYARRRFN